MANFVNMFKTYTYLKNVKWFYPSSLSKHNLLLDFRNPSLNVPIDSYSVIDNFEMNNAIF